jgi:hypothetical protein
VGGGRKGVLDMLELACARGQMGPLGVKTLELACARGQNGSSGSQDSCCSR